MFHFRRWQFRFACVLILISTWVAVTLPQTISAQPAASAQTQSELRGVWLTNVDSDVLFARDRLALALHDLAALNFNTVYPTVWNWGYTLFPSGVAQLRTGERQGLYPDLEQQGRNQNLEAAQGDRDMLAEVVELAHQEGLNVIPWFEFGLMAPADSELARRHPDWITQRRNGTQVVMEGSHPRIWLNPFHSEVQTFLMSLIDEVLTQYEVEGIQLDDHFGLPVELGYDPYTVSLYQQDHQGQLPPTDPHDEAWMQWRAYKLTQVMTRIAEAVKARQPNAIVSLSPNPQEFAYDTFLQDWGAWVRNGAVDQLVVQVYRDNQDRFLMELNHPAIKAAQRQIPVGIGILTGLKHRSVSLDNIQQQVQMVREHGLGGVSFFFYETLWTSKTETPHQRRAGLQRLFAN
jgi:uncharacterized lipoprotein YddW (UPF0748 family)